MILPVRESIKKMSEMRWEINCNLLGMEELQLQVKSILLSQTPASCIDLKILQQTVVGKRSNNTTVLQGGEYTLIH